MLEENISKRPTSGKYSQLRPITGRPKTSHHYINANINIENNNFNKFKRDKVTQKDGEKFGRNVITESIDENKNENENEYETKNNQISEKKQFLEAFEEEEDKDTFDKILTNEIKRLQNINDKKNELKKINLIERDYDDLYEWTNLFNNSRPLSSYVSIKKPKIDMKENNKIQEFKSPVVLVDLHEDQMNLYFGKNQFFKTDSEDKKNKIKNNIIYNKNITKNKKKSKDEKKPHININSKNKAASKSNNKNFNTTNKINSKFSKKISSNIKPDKNVKSQNINPNSKTLIHHHIRPMSVYSPRGTACSFYFSSAFSDYYKEDLKTFSEKMKILKAKIKSNPHKLSHEIKNQRIISSRKERELNRILSIEQLNLGKQDLITAADRRNPVPLLKSIFKQKYPNKEVIKENIKMYFNTMKPLGGESKEVDYTKNDRWRLSQQIEEMRERKKNYKLKLGNNNCNDYSKSSEYFNIKSTGNRNKHNLILSYYNKEDPYIQMLEKMISNRTNVNINNNVDEKIKWNNELTDIKYFNPILQNLNENYNISKNNKIIDENKEITNQNQVKKEDKENKENKEVETNLGQNINIKNQEKKVDKNIKSNKENKENKVNEEIDKNNTEKKIRPKTGFRSVGSNPKTSWLKRPYTSIFKRYNISYKNNQDIKKNSEDNNSLQFYYDQDDNQYVSSNSFPLKTISNVGNVSYDKINQMIQERQFGSIKLKYDYLITTTGQINKIPNSPKRKYSEDKILFLKNNIANNKENNKWNESFNKYKIKKNRINYYNFDNITNNFLKDNQKESLYTVNYFKNMRGKYYSSSNNVNVKNKRNNKNKMLNSIFNESRYSKDDPEVDLVDKAVSSQTDSSYRK